MKNYIIFIALVTFNYNTNCSQASDQSVSQKNTFTVTSTMQNRKNQAHGQPFSEHEKPTTDTVTDYRQRSQSDRSKKKDKASKKDVQYRDPTCWEECQADCYTGMRNDCLKCSACCATCTILAAAVSYCQPESADPYEVAARYSLPCFFLLPTAVCSTCAYKCHCKAVHLRSRKPLHSPNFPSME